MFLFLALCVHADETPFVHPSYYVQINQNDLDALNKDPYSDEYYPATFIYEDYIIPCEVRFRGATSRNYPKKSWKIKFHDPYNIFHVEKINLNAEYLDDSHLRNYLACKLFEFLNYPAPTASYANLFVNGEYFGLFLQVEQIDEYFLERNNKEPNSLYKAVNHAANSAPLASDSFYDIAYERKIGYNNQDIKLLFSKVKYWSDSDFNTQIEKEIDVEMFLQFYAVLFSIASNDNYVKNYYLFLNPDTGLFEWFPWDNDASFGNSWEGKYLDVFETFLSGSYLANNTIFRRLMNNEKWRVVFWDYVNLIALDGFPYLDSCITEIFSDIQHDVYQDNNKKGTNEDFDSAVILLRKFLSNRADFLKNADGVNAKPISDFYCSNPFPDNDSNTVIFTVKSTAPQKIMCAYCTDLDFNSFADSYTLEKFELFDDGEHNDGESGDLIYGNSLSITEDFKGLIPYMFVAGGFNFPENGFLYINRLRTHSFILNCLNEKTDSIYDLELGNVYFSGGNYFVEVINNSSNQLDISYCYLQCGKYYQNTLFPENTIISPNNYIIVATDNVMASSLFNDITVLGNTCFPPEYGESIKLLAPDLTTIYERICDELKSFENNEFKIVINEINYNPSEDFDSGDWVEFYNCENFPVDISGWTFRDCKIDHKFVFPLNTILESNGYIVISNDYNSFERFYSIGEKLVGEFEFGLCGSGEGVMLLNKAGVIVDSLTYDDRFPWPEEPDGEGTSLSLINPNLDNSLSESWSTSHSHGTPGKINDVYSTKIADGLKISNNFPNPFNVSTSISFSVTVEKKVKVDIYNITGQHISTLFNSAVSPGTYSVTFEAGSYPSGIYFYKVESNTSCKCGKMMLLK